MGNTWRLGVTSAHDASGCCVFARLCVRAQHHEILLLPAWGPDDWQYSGRSQAQSAITSVATVFLLGHRLEPDMVAEDSEKLQTLLDEQKRSGARIAEELNQLLSNYEELRSHFGSLSENG